MKATYRLRYPLNQNLMLKAKKPVNAAFCALIVLVVWVQVRQLSSLGQKQSRVLQSQLDLTSGEEIATKYRPIGFAARSRSRKSNVNLMKAGDFIFSEGWDSSPIVVESHKLVFFTVPKAGCTVWKQLFRRMKGYKDWNTQSTSEDYRQIPHNPKHNGLTYLHDYSLKEANRIMTSPEYTRAIFVRDPKERFLSAFLDKALSNDGTHVQSKCCPDGDCMKDAQTLPGFMKVVLKGCTNPHWEKLNKRMEPKYWKYIDFVGHVEDATDDAKRLLTKIGAWKEYGRSGWGSKGNQAIFETSKDSVSHATWAKWKMWQWYTPELETIVENFYAADYANPVLNLTQSKLY